MSSRKKDQESAPNKFTQGMGKLIKRAREDSGLSQEELAERVLRRRETISMLENGKNEVGSILLGRIADVTKKPITYFFPDFAKRQIVEEDLPDDEYELIRQFRRIWNTKYREIALKQLQVMAEIDEKEVEEGNWRDILENLDKDDPMYKRLKERGIIKD